MIPGIMEHIERAGVHSGDSIAVYPPFNLSAAFQEKVCDISVRLALALGTRGRVNIQYLIDNQELYVIEVNPRASRTIPYISKVTGVPMEVALLTEQIKALTEHLKKNHKDAASKRGLMILVGQRRSLLDYLARTDRDAYLRLIVSLGLRK